MFVSLKLCFVLLYFMFSKFFPAGFAGSAGSAGSPGRLDRPDRLDRLDRPEQLLEVAAKQVLGGAKKKKIQSLKK